MTSGDLLLLTFGFRIGGLGDSGLSRSLELLFVVNLFCSFYSCANISFMFGGGAFTAVFPGFAFFARSSWCFFSCSAESFSAFVGEERKYL